jgi:hypothetical protein
VKISLKQNGLILFLGSLILNRTADARVFVTDIQVLFGTTYKYSIKTAQLENAQVKALGYANDVNIRLTTSTNLSKNKPPIQLKISKSDQLKEFTFDLRKEGSNRQFSSLVPMNSQWMFTTNGGTGLFIENGSSERRALLDVLAKHFLCEHFIDYTNLKLESLSNEPNVNKICCWSNARLISLKGIYNLEKIFAKTNEKILACYDPITYTIFAITPVQKGSRMLIRIQLDASLADTLGQEDALAKQACQLISVENTCIRALEDLCTPNRSTVQ